jgi:hypothetical protein
MAQHDDKQAERLNRELTKYQALDEAEIDTVIRQLLEEPKGQKFIWWLLQIGKVGVQPFSTERSITDFQCGELNVGQQMLARLIDVNPMGFAQMQLKRKQEDEYRHAAAQRISTGNDLFAEPGTEPDSGHGGD